MPTNDHESVIAIVDDDPEFRKALKRLLRAAGFSVEAFPSGEEFLAAADIVKPDCLLLDMHMLGISGLEVQQQLVTMGKDFPVIIISGRDEPGVAEKALACGVAAFFHKPIDGNVLLRAVDQVLAA
jgi:FixJ family two-component response regulator